MIDKTTEGDFSEFEDVSEQRPRFGFKWDNKRIRDTYGSEDVLPFAHAEMDFPTPGPIREALVNRAQQSFYGYTLLADEYYDAIINWFGRRHQWKMTKEDILYSRGVIISLYSIIEHFSEPGDSIIIQPPVYKPLGLAAIEQNRQLVFNPLKLVNDRYEMDYDDLQIKIEKHRPKILILCNPHNPVGRVWSVEELRQLSEICLANNVLVVSDDMHADLVSPDKTYTPYAAVSQECAHYSIINTSPTKVFNLSGLKISNIHIQNPTLRKSYFENMDRLFPHAPNLFAIEALIAGYQTCDQWVDKLRIYLDDNFKYAKSKLEENCPKLKITRREGTPLLWIDFNKTDVPTAELNQFIKSKGKIASEDGTYFMLNGEGFQRFSLGFSRNIIEEGINRVCGLFAN